MKRHDHIVTSSPLRHQPLLKVALILLFLATSACAQAPESPATSSSSSDAGVQEEMSTVARDLAGSTEMATQVDLSMKEDAGARTRVLKLVPVKWEGDEQGHVYEEVEVALEGQERASVTWPAGMWHVRVVDDGQALGLRGTRLSGVSRTRDTLLVETQIPTGEEAVLFNAVSSKVSISYDDTALALTLDRDVKWEGSSPAPRFDEGRQGSAGVGDLVDQTIAKLNVTDAPDDVVGELLDLLRTHLDAPVMTGDGRMLWFAPGDSDVSPPQMRGTFSGWQASSEHTLKRLNGKLWARFVNMPPGAHRYKLVYDDGTNPTWFPDRSNRHLEWDGIDTGGVGNFNSVLTGEQGKRFALLWLRGFEGVHGGSPRDIYVHLPSSYDEGPQKEFPVVYIHDGNESITRGEFVAQAKALEASNPSSGVVLVFIALPSQEIRLQEYTMGTPQSRGDQYTKFLVEDLIPWVEGNFKVVTAPRGRGVVGASLGGLISFWIASKHPEVFGWAGGMSSSFFWENELMIRTMEDKGCQGMRFYLDSGTPRDNMDVTRKMRDLLQRKGCPHDHVEEEGGQHEWSYWQGRFTGVLNSFLRTTR